MKDLTYMQPITRVHNIFRLRTIVNSTTKLNNRKKYPRDTEIGAVLADMRLSKFRKDKTKDRILRRARDHLLTASYMGLLSRSGKPFQYVSTSTGRLLAKYRIDTECPKDEKEEAVFIDRIMRMKLTNIYDLQFGKQYQDVRSRPCLYILEILNHSNILHELQIAISLGCKRCDPVLMDVNTKNTLKNVKSKEINTAKDFIRFFRIYKINESDRKNMIRNVRPLIDWLEDLGLIDTIEISKVPGKSLKITERGKYILSIYSKYYPVWYNDFASIPQIKSAILLLYNYAKKENISISKQFQKNKINYGLASIKLSKVINEIKKDTGIKFKTSNSELKQELDFCIEYDIPPEFRNDVRNILKRLSLSLDIFLDDIIVSMEKEPIVELSSFLKREHDQIRNTFTGQFSQKTRISEDPILKRVSNLIPSMGILNQYRSDFEKLTVILLKLLELNVNKYQGQLADRCKKQYAIRFFENNPDILITNGIEALVECKSTGEWHLPLSNKGIQKELFIYQQHLSQVKSNSVILVYEGSLDTKSYKIIIDILDVANDLIFVTKNYLIRCAVKPILKERLLKTIKKPRDYDAVSRVLK